MDQPRSKATTPWAEPSKPASPPPPQPNRDPLIGDAAKALSLRCLANAAQLLQENIKPLSPEGSIQIDRAEGALKAAERLVALAEKLDILGDKVELRSRITFTTSAAEVGWKELADWAWTILANASEGDWGKQRSDWQEAAGKWRDDYHRLMRGGR